MLPIAKACSRQLPRLPGLRVSQLSVMVASTLMLISATAGADEQDPFNIVAGASVRYEDNLFRLKNDSQAVSEVGKTQRSDWIYTEFGGIKIDKPYSLQRFQFDLTAFHTHNQTYHFLDFSGVNYRGAWLWELTPRITGELSASQNQSITPFSEFRGTTSNVVLNRRSVQTNESRVFSFDGDVGAGFHLIGGATESRSRNSQNSTAVGDYVQDGVELGVKYVAPSNNYISLTHREANGDFGRSLDAFNQLDSGFEQHETEAKLFWLITGKSEVDARLDYLEREHDHFSSRDFSGMTGNVTYHWMPTGKLRLDTMLYRNLTSFQEFQNSYYVTEGISISPVWSYSEKTTFRAKYDYSDRDYRGNLIPVTKMREDRVQVLSLNADWKATRNVLVSGVIQHEDRSSNFSVLDYKANFIGVNAQLLFW